MLGQRSNGSKAPHLQRGGSGEAKVQPVRARQRAAAGPFADGAPSGSPVTVRPAWTRNGMTDKSEGVKTDAAEAPSRRFPSARPPGTLSPLRPAPYVVRPLLSRLSDKVAEPKTPTPTEKRLIIGRDITVSGEIGACDRLVVEGRVEATLPTCRDLTVAPGGVFKGAATIDDAEIRGRFEGTLTVRKRLVIRAGGSLMGTVRYGTIEVERGAHLAGDVQAEAPPKEPR